jgi:FPC/CPF motif-containing protein YcgG
MDSFEIKNITDEFFAYINNNAFPCIGAKAALARQTIKCIAVDHMACPKDDPAILQFLYEFVDVYRNSKEHFHTAVIIFKEPIVDNEELFDALLWQRLQSLAELDAKNYDYDKRVDDLPYSANFSYSLKEEAFFIIGLHPSSSRQARQFNYPALVFNPHQQFEELRKINQYEKMKAVIRSRDIESSGSINPMLKDFGEASEVFQYSGRKYDNNWKCPLNPEHGKNKHNTST